METLLSLLGFLWKSLLGILWGPEGRLDNSTALRATSPWTEYFADLRRGDCSDPGFIVIILRDLVPLSWGRFRPCSHTFSGLGILCLWRLHFIGGAQYMHSVVAMEFSLDLLREIAMNTSLMRFYLWTCSVKTRWTPIRCGSITGPAVWKHDEHQFDGIRSLDLFRNLVVCQGRNVAGYCEMWRKD